MGNDSLVCGAFMSLKNDTTRAVEEASEQCLSQIDHAPDLVFVFFTIKHDAAQIRDQLRHRFPKAIILGCCGETIVGGSKEIEGEYALSLWMARLPGVTLNPFHLSYASEIDQGSFLGWTDDLLSPWPKGSILILFGEPFTFPADRLAVLLNEEQPGIPIIGGMASGGDRPKSHRLILNESLHEEGAVGVRLHGSLATRMILSQGCRPIGHPYVITKADRNVIFELGGKKALDQLQGLFEELGPEDKEKIQHGIHVGRVINEYKSHFDRGDFLVRNVIGADQSTGAIAIGDFVRPGQTIQFHIRDAESADEDLKQAFHDLGNTPRGALLFSCNGRGSRLFGEPDHDARIVSEALHHVPLAGFFAAGELGPVGEKNFLHGFTASVLIFESNENGN